MKNYVIVALIALIFLIVRHIPEFAAYDFKAAGIDIFDKLTDEIWIALFIAIVIGILIEKASYDNIRNAINETSATLLEDARKILRATEEASQRSQQNIFISAFRKTIPQDVFDAANKVVFETKFLRTNHQHTWRFKVVNINGVTRLAAHVTANYTISNLTGSPEQFAIRIQIERSSKPPPGQVVKFIQIDGIDQDLRRMTESPESPEDPNVVYELPPIIIDGGGRKHIKLEFQFIRKMEDREIWLSAYPEDGMELRIFDPANCRRIEFKADAIGPLEVQRTRAEDGATALIRETMLPFQGLSFSWNYQVIDATEPPQISTPTNS